jgi:hypothetical protein
MIAENKLVLEGSTFVGLATNNAIEYERRNIVTMTEII